MLLVIDVESAQWFKSKAGGSVPVYIRVGLKGRDHDVSVRHAFPRSGDLAAKLRRQIFINFSRFQGYKMWA
jgi:hypothetical protein